MKLNTLRLVFIACLSLIMNVSYAGAIKSESPTHGAKTIKEESNKKDTDLESKMAPELPSNDPFAKYKERIKALEQQSRDQQTVIRELRTKQGN
jgi:hypothetical protein